MRANADVVSAIGFLMLLLFFLAAEGFYFLRIPI